MAQRPSDPADRRRLAVPEAPEVDETTGVPYVPGAAGAHGAGGGNGAGGGDGGGGDFGGGGGGAGGGAGLAPRGLGTGHRGAGRWRDPADPDRTGRGAAGGDRGG